jgi:dihydroorotate dehydrogenase (NAD+) catalytic subunit
VPIIGTGGVTNGLDAIEMLMAGATTVGVGSAVYYRGVGAIAAILAEMQEWLDGHGYTLADVQSSVHRERVYSVAPTRAPVPQAH